MRLKGLHIVTPSKAITAVVSILKQVLSEKLGGRIHSHKSFETVYEHLPKKILPEEYGGEERSLKKLNGNTTTVTLKYSRYSLRFFDTYHFPNDILFIVLSSVKVRISFSLRGPWME